MDGIPDFALSVAVAFAAALGAWPILRGRFGLDRFVIPGIASVVLLLPLLIPAGKVGQRAIASILFIELFFKMLDYARQCRSSVRESWPFARYAKFLIPFPVMLVLFGRRERRVPTSAPRRIAAVSILVLAAGVLAGGTVLLHWLSQSALLQSRFELDHVLKVAIFVLTVESLARLIHRGERLAGFDTSAPMRSTYLSCSAADFWCRYNTRVHAWFAHNVFRPAGGRGAPVRAVLCVFLVSAVFHELMFGIATSRFDGYQFAFFMLQVPAVLASRSLHRLAKRGGAGGKLLAHAVTVLWLLLTSMLFFHGVDRVFPFFYAGEPWLP